MHRKVDIARTAASRIGHLVPPPISHNCSNNYFIRTDIRISSR